MSAAPPHPLAHLPCWRWLTVLLGVLAAAGPGGADDWKFDILHLKNGRSLQGLLLEETPAQVRFQYVRRNPGVPTLALVTTFRRDEVDRVERLGPADRQLLAGRLALLDPHRREESVRLEKLELEPAPWNKDPKGGQSYTSAHFVLVSNARQDLIRRAALRLEEIYAAYARFVPPRHPTAAPTRITLVRSLAEYQALLRARGRTLANPAFYDAAANEVVCASDLERLDELFDDARRRHDKELERIDTQEAKVKKMPKGPVRDGLMKQVVDARKAVAAANGKNDALFRAATAKLFQTLYHEAFHAYLANFVYPEKEAEVPRWLNEGLAQIFETALVEAGELRVGHADKDRLGRVKAALRKGELMPVADLLTAGPRRFLVAHADQPAPDRDADRQASERCYLASWALAFYLTFERRLLGTPRLDGYVRACKRGVSETTAFRDLVGQTLPEFEKAFHQYLLGLRPDGSTAAAPR